MAHFELLDRSHLSENSEVEDIESDNRETSSDQLSDVNDSTDDAEVTFELIRSIGNRQLLFDSEHPHHKNRNFLTKAWMEVSEGLSYRGSMMTWKGCRDKWRNLRIYYFRLKRDRKGKSGDGRTNSKPWMYYKAVHNIMQRCASENEETISNMDDDVVDPTSSASTDTSGNPDEEPSRVLNELIDPPTPIASASKPSRKRKIATEDETSKIIDLLRNSGKDEDEFFHFGMNLAEKLRRMEPQKAALAQMQITSLVYEIEFMD